MTDLTGSEEPTPYDAVDQPVVPVVPIAPGPAGIALPPAVLAGGLHDDPTPVATTEMPGSSSSHTAEAPGDHAHPHGSGSHTHGEVVGGSSALDRLVDSVRGMFHRSAKP